MLKNNHLDPEQKVRFCVIGTGRIAQTHLEVLATMPQATISCVVELRENMGRAAAEQYRCRFFTDYQDAQILELCDAIVICTPPSSHSMIAAHFLGQQKHVLCEKPFTITSAEAHELVQLSEKNDLVLMMASKFRYVDDVIKAKGILESGLLGQIVMYENTFCSKVNMASRWNADSTISGGGVLIDNGTHSMDIARFLLGPIQDVQVQAGISSQKLAVEETIRLQFRTVSGVIGSVDLSWSINKESSCYLSLYGTEGTLLVNWSGSKYRQEGSPHWTPFGAGYNKGTAFGSQLANFIGTIQGQELPLITAYDALASVQVIEKAYVSLAENHWIPVEA